MTVEDVKKALRLKNASFDSEIEDLIASAKLDLKISGVANIDDSNKLVARAIILYCKAHFGMDNANGEKYLESYTSLKTHLSLADGYRVEVTS